MAIEGRALPRESGRRPAVWTRLFSARSLPLTEDVLREALCRVFEWAARILDPRWGGR